MDSLFPPCYQVKVCVKCSKLPPQGKEPFPAWCKLCLNAYNKACAKNHPTPERGHGKQLHRIYGMTEEKYNFMLFHQGGVCAICKKPEKANTHKSGKVKRLAVDHNHETGKIRQLLCQRCNLLVGYIESDRHVADEALKYLNRHSKQVQGIGTYLED